MWFITTLFKKKKKKTKNKNNKTTTTTTTPNNKKKRSRQHFDDDDDDDANTRFKKQRSTNSKPPKHVWFCHSSKSFNNTVFGDACTSLAQKLGAFHHTINDDDDQCLLSLNTHDRVDMKHFSLFASIQARLKLESNTLSINVLKKDKNKQTMHRDGYDDDDACSKSKNNNNSTTIDNYSSQHEYDMRIVDANVKHLVEHFKWHQHVKDKTTSYRRATAHILKHMRTKHRRSFKFAKCVAYNNNASFLFVFNARDATSCHVECLDDVFFSNVSSRTTTNDAADNVCSSTTTNTTCWLEVYNDQSKSKATSGRRMLRYCIVIDKDRLETIGSELMMLSTSMEVVKEEDDDDE